MQVSVAQVYIIVLKVHEKNETVGRKRFKGRFMELDYGDIFVKSLHSSLFIDHEGALLLNKVDYA